MCVCFFVAQCNGIMTSTPSSPGHFHLPCVPLSPGDIMQAKLTLQPRPDLSQMDVELEKEDEKQTLKTKARILLECGTSAIWDHTSPSP